MTVSPMARRAALPALLRRELELRPDVDVRHRRPVDTAARSAPLPLALLEHGGWAWMRAPHQYSKTSLPVEPFGSRMSSSRNSPARGDQGDDDARAALKRWRNRG